MRRKGKKIKFMKDEALGVEVEIKLISNDRNSTYTNNTTYFVGYIGSDLRATWKNENPNELQDEINAWFKEQREKSISWHEYIFIKRHQSGNAQEIKINSLETEFSIEAEKTVLGIVGEGENKTGGTLSKIQRNITGWGGDFDWFADQPRTVINFETDREINKHVEAIENGKSFYTVDHWRRGFNIPYTDEAWDTIVQLATKMRDADKILTELVRNSEGIKKIANSFGNELLLSSGE